MPYEEQRQLQEFLLPRYQKDYDDMPKTTNIGWLKNYFRGHFLPSLKRHFCIIIFFGVCLLILLCSQHNSESGIFFMEGEGEKNSNYFPASSTKERFITFLPHGDLFQQKQELENAVFLATTLGRTLIVPPMILGLDVEFTNSHGLRKKLESLRTNKRDSECFVKTTTEQKEIKYEIDVNCLNEYDSYSLLPWDSLFDLNWIKGRLHVLHRKNFNQTQLEQMLNVTNPKRDVHEIMKSSLKGRPIPLNAIRSRHEKLFIFDSLLTKDFSGKDLSQQDRRFWDQLDSSLDVNNPEILDVTRRIIQKLGGKGKYVGVHARFVSTLSSQGFIETSLINLTVSLRNYFNQISQDPCAKGSPVIYLATDLSRNDTNLSSFSSQFPCIVMLSDFEKILLPLLELYNPIDETFLFKFLEPLVNSIIASSGMELFSVDDGVYSEYAKKLHQGIRI